MLPQYFLSHLQMREWRAIEMGLTTKEVTFRRSSEVKQLLL